MTKPSIVSLFSGAGGMDLGLSQAGFETIWANDIDQAACHTYRQNLGDHIICKSIREISSDDIPDSDIIVGGPPCQGFSVAGKMDLADPRSQLVWEFCRVVIEKQPRYFIMENVAALSTNPKFNILHDALIRTFKENGYTVKFQTLNSQDYGVPQSRERFFILGSLDAPIWFPDPINTKIPVREAIKDLQPPVKLTCSAKIALSPTPIMRKSPYAGMLFNGGRPLDPDRPSCTLVASMGGNRTPLIEQNLLNDPTAESWIRKLHSEIEKLDVSKVKIPGYIRRLTVPECARLQGFPDDFVFTGSFSQQYRQIGNSVTPPLAKHIGLAVMASIQGVVLLPVESVLDLF